MSLELTHPTLLHPRTGEPLRAIGVRPNGDPLWPIMGGDGTEPDANHDGGETGGQGGGQGGQGGGDTGGQDGADGQDGEDGGEDTDPRVQRANRQAANYRTQLREAETAREQTEQQLQEQGATLEALRRALDPNGGSDGEPDPAELTGQVQTLTGQVESLTDDNRQLRQALLVHDLAPDNGANATALLDSRSFTESLQALDAEADNYRDQVAEAIKDAASKNAAYQSGQGSGRGGSELDTERREQRRQRPGSLADAIGSAMGG